MSASDLARVGEVLAARGGRLGRPVHVLAETGSTNDEAKAGARAGAPHGAMWIAESQTRGRGRQGRRWGSPPGEGLLFSVLLRLTCAPPKVPPLSLVCGLAVRDAVAKALGEGQADRARVKWPNDVLVRGLAEGTPMRKVAGILVESSLSGARVEHVIVGIGINVHTTVFPAEIEPIATSLAREGAPHPDRAALLADVLEGLDRDLEKAAHRGLAHVHARLAQHDALFGRVVASDDGRLGGIARGIDAEGRLLVERSDGVIVRAASGEVRAV